jgi:hypothetical protein
MAPLSLDYSDLRHHAVPVQPPPIPPGVRQEFEQLMARTHFKRT